MLKINQNKKEKLHIFIFIPLLIFSVGIIFLPLNNVLADGIVLGDIVIDEIMANPEAVSDANGEWFEILNTTNNDINLNTCIISDNGSNSHIISSDLIVPAGKYAVLARNATSTENGGISPDYIYSGFILANTADEIILNCGGKEIDRVEYDNGTNFPYSPGKSIVLNNPANDNNSGNNWCLSGSIFGNGDFGTPGALNDSCGSAEIFGSIKVCEYDDMDGDLTTTDDRFAVNNWNISLSATNTPEISIATSTMTGDDGCAIFAGVKIGDYEIREDSRNNWLFLEESSKIIAISSSTEYSVNFYNSRYGSISGYKYEDIDGLASTSEDQIALFNSLINLFNEISTTSPITATSTNLNGYFEFLNLVPGNYILSEEIADGLIETSAPTSTIKILSGTASTLNNFINTKIKTEEKQTYCGDGIKQDLNSLGKAEECDGSDGISNGQKCSSQCLIEVMGGGLTIFPPAQNKTTVLGEEGKPILSVKKTVNKFSANPGNELEYFIKIKNSGNLTALTTILYDNLDTGLIFSDGGGTSKDFLLGDINAGEEKIINYKVKISENINYGNYLNTAKVSADNFKENAEDSVSIEVLKINPIIENDKKETGASTSSTVFPQIRAGAKGDNYEEINKIENSGLNIEKVNASGSIIDREDKIKREKIVVYSILIGAILLIFILKSFY